MQYTERRVLWIFRWPIGSWRRLFITSRWEPSNCTVIIFIIFIIFIIIIIFIIFIISHPMPIVLPFWRSPPLAALILGSSGFLAWYKPIEVALYEEIFDFCAGVWLLTVASKSNALSYLRFEFLILRRCSTQFSYKRLIFLFILLLNENAQSKMSL